MIFEILTMILLSVLKRQAYEVKEDPDIHV